MCWCVALWWDENIRITDAIMSKIINVQYWSLLFSDKYNLLETLVAVYALHLAE